MPLDPKEPERVAKTAALMELRHVVLTSVTRDDLPDGGASAFSQSVDAIRHLLPDCSAEILVPDFGGDRSALATAMACRPDILNHNLETVQRLYPTVRAQADYQRSLDLLAQAKELDNQSVTKSGVMVGLGEEWEELLATMDDLRAVGCDILTLGQYLQPSRYHLRIERYYTPDEFERLRAEAEARGFSWVEAGPLVRSSYHAERQIATSRSG
jgi:lipoic acid synthetase